MLAAPPLAPDRVRPTPPRRRTGAASPWVGRYGAPMSSDGASGDQGGRLASLSPRTRLVLALVGLVVGVLLILFGVGVLDKEASDSNGPTTTTQPR